MKKTTTYLLVTLGMLSIGVSSARTWTSSNGSKTFKGDFKSYNEVTGVVKVMKGFREVSFHTDKLSKADGEWLKSQTPAGKTELSAVGKAEAAAAELEKQAIGSKIAKGVLSKLEDGAFVDFTMTTAPEYYVIYYSGSW